jgi:hypothetical protein
MGHERIGTLPKSKRWRAIVSEVASAGTSSASASEIASHTLDALGSRYRNLAQDQSVQEAFDFLVNIARTAGNPKTTSTLSNETPLSLVVSLTDKLGTTHRSLETRELVQRAAADALAAWYRGNSSTQAELFRVDPAANAWHSLGTGAGFCELSRLYFSRLTERYLNYFLDREASSVLPSLTARQHFQHQLREHVADVSRLSFESAKITQSYAAGWFNKYAQTGDPSATQKRKFLAYAFDKLREEFHREGKQ